MLSLQVGIFKELSTIAECTWLPGKLATPSDVAPPTFSLHLHPPKRSNDSKCLPVVFRTSTERWKFICCLSKMWTINRVLVVDLGTPHPVPTYMGYVRVIHTFPIPV